MNTTNSQITIEQFRNIAKRFEEIRSKMVDALIVVKSRWDDIQKHLADETPSGVYSDVVSRFHGLPVHVVADDIMASKRLFELRESTNRVTVVYEDRIVEVDIEGLFPKTEFVPTFLDPSTSMFKVRYP